MNYVSQKKVSETSKRLTAQKTWSNPNHPPPPQLTKPTLESNFGMEVPPGEKLGNLKFFGSPQTK